MAEIKLSTLKLTLKMSIDEIKARSQGAINVTIFPEYLELKAALEALERGEKLKIVP